MLFLSLRHCHSFYDLINDSRRIRNEILAINSLPYDNIVILILPFYKHKISLIYFYLKYCDKIYLFYFS